MVVGNTMNETVTADEASIFQDFFRVQADKHGPEMLKKLNNIEWGRSNTESCIKPEQRPEVKIEVEAEQVVKHEIATEQGLCNKMTQGFILQKGGEGSPDQISFLVSSESEKLQYLMSQDGSIIPLIHESLLSNMPMNLQTVEQPSPQGKPNPSIVQPKRGISVIQRAPPKAGRSDHPKIILEKRVQEVPLQVKQEVMYSAESQDGESKPMIIDNITGAIETREPRLATQVNNPFVLKTVQAPYDTTGHANGFSQRGRKSNQQQSDHLICEVCGERAGKHSYYGGQVCPSCRAFFRRSVQSRYNETFKCTKGKEDCHITLMTRKNCQFCRYQKCITAGMRPSWILSDEERVRRFHGRGKGKPTSPQHSPYQVASRSPELQKEPENLICAVAPNPDPNPYSFLEEVDKARILQYGEVMRRCCTQRHDDIEPQLLTDILQITLHGTSLSGQAAVQLHNIIETRTRSCFNLFQEFQALSPSDQAAIIEHNLPLVHRFRQAICLTNPSLTWRAMMELFIGEDKLREAENLPHDLSGKDSPKKMFEYSDLFTAPWCQCKELEDTQKALMEDIASWVDVDDDVQIILLVFILAFNHDFLDLKDRCQVEKIQMKFVLLLQAHLRATYPGTLATSKLAKAAMLPAVCRQIYQLTKKRLII